MERPGQDKITHVVEELKNTWTHGSFFELHGVLEKWEMYP